MMPKLELPERGGFSVEERILMEIGHIIGMQFLCEDCRIKTITDSDDWWIEAKAVIRKTIDEHVAELKSVKVSPETAADRFAAEMLGPPYHGVDMKEMEMANDRASMVVAMDHLRRG